MSQRDSTKERGMKQSINVIVILVIMLLFVGIGTAKAHETAKLKDANIVFKTAAKSKKADTRVIVEVYCNDGSVAASNTPVQTYGKFEHFTKSAPIDLVVDPSKAKDEIKGGYYMISIEPVGHEIWTFSYTLTLNFDDGTHLVYVHHNRKVTQDDTTVRGHNL
jgi:hypothetical protein